MEQSLAKPMNHSCRCCVALLSTTNFISEWITVTKALPGLSKRNVLKSWRAPATSWKFLIYCELPTMSFCHFSLRLVSASELVPHLVRAAKKPEYGTDDTVLCTCLPHPRYAPPRLGKAPTPEAGLCPSPPPPPTGCGGTVGSGCGGGDGSCFLPRQRSKFTWGFGAQPSLCCCSEPQ
jgi:hypothetical protein